MKKLFTLCLALLALSSMPAMAQDSDEDEIDNTLQFVDSKGNVIADGSEITVDSLEDKGFECQVSSGLFVNNTSSETVYAGMEVNITRLDNGSISCCFPVNCQIGEHVGTFSTMAVKLSAAHRTKLFRPNGFRVMPRVMARLQLYFVYACMLKDLEPNISPLDTVLL